MNSRTLVLILTGLISSLGCVKEVIDDRLTGIRSGTRKDGPSFVDGEINRLRKKVKRFPELVELHLKIANLLTSKEKHYDAAAEIKEAIYKEPKNARYHFELGRVYQRMGKWNLAEVSFKQVVGLCQTERYSGPHMTLGFSLAMQDKYQEALEQFDQALEIEPDLPQAYYWIGSIQDILGDQEKAIEAWEEYLKLGGPHPQQIYNRLRKLLKLQEVRLAKPSRSRRMAPSQETKIGN